MRRYGRVCQIGLQQRSSREFRFACRLVREGVLGRIKIAYVVFPGVSADVELPADPVPDNSILREFIGNSILENFRLWTR